MFDGNYREHGTETRAGVQGELELFRQRNTVRVHSIYGAISKTMKRELKSQFENRFSLKEVFVLKSIGDYFTAYSATAMVKPPALLLCARNRQVVVVFNIIW